MVSWICLALWHWCPPAVPPPTELLMAASTFSLTSVVNAPSALAWPTWLALKKKTCKPRASQTPRPLIFAVKTHLPPQGGAPEFPFEVHLSLSPGSFLFPCFFFWPCLELEGCTKKQLW